MEILDKLAEFSPEWFDASSVAWKLNKKRAGESYVYICSNDKCKRKVISDENYCTLHFRNTRYLYPSNQMILRPRPKK